MSEVLTLDISQIVSEDDTPVDNLSEKQQHLLTEALYSLWLAPNGSTRFLAAAEET